MRAEEFIEKYEQTRESCEGILLPDGSVEESLPSHISKLAELSGQPPEKLNGKMEKESTPICWLAEYTGCIPMWHTRLILPSGMTRHQKETVKKLKEAGFLSPKCLMEQVREEDVNSVSRAREELSGRKIVLKNKRAAYLRLIRYLDTYRLLPFLEKAEKQSRFFPGRQEWFPREGEDAAEFFARQDEENSPCFVVEIDNMLAGRACVSRCSGQRGNCDIHRADISVAVLREYWQLGIGTELLNECKRWCIQSGVEQLEASVASSNLRAKRVLRRVGFLRVGKLPRAWKNPDGTYVDGERWALFLKQEEKEESRI